MPVITEKKLRAVVRNYLTENRLVEQPESTDELQKIVVKLGLGDAVNKSVLAAAMKAGSGRNAKQNKVIADLFMGMLDKGDEIVKIIPLLKKAASEESTTPTP
tara:strand:+ start:1505 stop:1813 length:309 start_codon:yes stop_codon:yes gene_type:complete